MTTPSQLFKTLREENPLFDSDLLKASIGADLATACALAQRTQSDLAIELGLSRARVNQMLAGSANLTIESIVKLAGALDYEVDVVFRRKNQPRALNAWERESLEADKKSFRSNVVELSLVKDLKGRAAATSVPSFRLDTLSLDGSPVKSVYAA